MKGVRACSTLIIQALINGVMNGAIYALIAVGITVIFGVMRLINFASGAYLMLSMYIGLHNVSVNRMELLCADSRSGDHFSACCLCKL